jgi:hypothetical protein
LVRSWSAREAWLTPQEFASELHSSTYAPLLGCDSWRACSNLVRGARLQWGSQQAYGAVVLLHCAADLVFFSSGGKVGCGFGNADCTDQTPELVAVQLLGPPCCTHSRKSLNCNAPPCCPPAPRCSHPLVLATVQYRQWRSWHPGGTAPAPAPAPAAGAATTTAAAATPTPLCWRGLAVVPTAVAG